MPFPFLRRKAIGELKPITENPPEPTSNQSRRGSKEAIDLIPIKDLQISKKTSKELYELSNSLFLTEDYAGCIEFLNKAITLPDSHGPVFALLGFCYEFGLGVQLDFNTAESFYLQAATYNNGVAYARLSFLRYYGRPNVVIDRVEAESWKKKAAQLGAKGIEWLRIAAEEYQIPTACYAYGVCFHDG
jgi:TPR repeat protein